MAGRTEEACYWKHPPQPGGRFPCLDGKSMVCTRCCVERCPVDTPDWFRRCTALGHPTWPAARERQQVPAKLVCLESYWNNRLFDTVSVKGFLEAMRPLANPPLQVAHRFVESGKGLAHYTRRPDGLLWREREAWDAPIYYLAFHGAPATVRPVLDRIGSARLCQAFAGYGDGGYRNLVYFAACSVLRGARGLAFARRFIRATGVRAVIGYATDVNWMASLLADMLFLQRFYSDARPWANLQRIFASVQRDYPAARRLGHTLVRAEDL